MASIPKESRLLAIALLNYADDQGYFYAVPQVIRGALFPFDDDSTTIRRGLDDLSRCGYIRSGTSSDGKKVCHIINFREHQKIDKPQPSKIAASGVEWGEFDEHSTNAPRTLDEQSSTEGKGMEKEWNGREDIRGSKTRTKAKYPDEAEWVSYCLETWGDWHVDCIKESHAYYESVGWRTKAGAIKDWKATARTAHGNAGQWGKLQPRAAECTPPTLEEWFSEGARLNREAPRNTPEWSAEAAEAIWYENQAKGWRFVQDWKASILAAYNRFLGAERQFMERRQR